MPSVWYYAHWTEPFIQRCIRRESSWEPPHASFTYIRTATTSPIIHFCGERGRSEVRPDDDRQRWWTPSYREDFKLQLSSRGYFSRTLKCEYSIFTVNLIPIGQHPCSYIFGDTLSFCHCSTWLYIYYIYIPVVQEFAKQDWENTLMVGITGHEHLHWQHIYYKWWGTFAQTY